MIVQQVMWNLLRALKDNTLNPVDGVYAALLGSFFLDGNGQSGLLEQVIDGFLHGTIGCDDIDRHTVLKRRVIYGAGIVPQVQINTRIYRGY